MSRTRQQIKYIFRQATRQRSRAYFLACALLLLATSCRFGRNLPPTPQPLSANAIQAQSYEIFTVQRGDLVLATSFEGQINLGRQTELFFERDGRIKNFLAQNGDFVRADALIAELDNDDLLVEMTQAEWDLEIVRRKQAEFVEDQADQQELANQQVKIAELALASLLAKELAEPGSIPAERLAEFEHNLTEARIAVKRLARTNDLELQKEFVTAQVQVQQLQAQIEEGRLIAPFAGKVYYTAVDETTLQRPINAYDPVVNLVDLDSLQIEASPLAATLDLLDEGMAVTMTLDYRPGVVLSGTIRYLPFPLGSGVEPFVQIVTTPTAEGKLRIGGKVQVQVEIQRRENVLWLPPTVLDLTTTPPTVTVLENEQLREVVVQIGLQTAERVEILAGLTADQQVIRKQL